MRGKKGQIVFTEYTPYLVVNVKLFNNEGKEIEVPEVYSLCRCGKSKGKPFCDGTHSKISFVGYKEKEDKRGIKAYEGEKITIFDNRYICQHKGACKLDGVFKFNSKPWIDPDGCDDVSKIIDVIKLCPSGALTYSVDGVEVRSWHEDQKIIVSKDGPYCIEGEVDLFDTLMSSKILVSKEHYTLCRCGESHKKPFCDGSHYDITYEG